MSEIKRKRKTKQKKFSVKDLVVKLIHPIKKGDRAFWGKEMTLLKKLIEKYPNIEFWEKASLKKVPSFAIYLTTEDRYLYIKYQEFLFQPETPKEEIKLAEKTGEDYNTANKPKTIKDFLK